MSAKKPPVPPTEAPPGSGPTDGSVAGAAALSDEDRAALLRWRLVVGPGAERTRAELSMGALGGAAEAAAGLDGGRLGELDRALDFVYPDGERRGGSGPSSPYVPQWLAALREFFQHDVVALVQKDAIERRGLTQLLFEPETLPFLEKDVDLVATLIAAKGLVPDKAKDIARAIVREVVDELRKKLELEVRMAVLGALRRDLTSPLKTLKNLDWKRTIRSNLKTWDRERQRLVPEKLHFWANERRRHEWDVAIVVDQSGSMGQSVVYSAVMAAIFASLNVLRTRLAFFDTAVVDVTEMLDDPVDVLFAAQLGGGTDINQAVAYAQERFIERPEKTIFLLITDLYEGGNADELVARLRALVESKVKALCLLALSDAGRPAYHHELAARVEAVGVPCFGCTPRKLVALVERVLKGQPLAGLAASLEGST